jgi:outer membrane protein assembly factor BamB
MKTSFISLLLMILAAVLINISTFAQKPDPDIWPNFRGVNSSGIAAEKQNPPVNFSPEQNLVWKTVLPQGHSSPCIWGDNIFITGFEEEEKLLNMFCLNRENGRIKWQKNISVKEFEPANPLNNPATATPATDGKRVYFYFSAYGILCYDFEGTLIWELTLPIQRSHHGMGTSPIIKDDMVILNFLGQWDNPRLLALNKNDGSTVWEYALPKRDNYDGDSYSTPVIYNDQVIIYSSDDVAGYDLKTGQRIWRFVIGVSDAVCTPVIGKDILYTTGHSTFGNPDMLAQLPDFTEIAAKYDKNKDSLIDENEIKDFHFLMYPEKPELSVTVYVADYFWMVDKDNNGSFNRTEWEQLIDFFRSFYAKEGIKAIKLGGEGDVSITNLLWNNPEQASHVSSPLYYNNKVYMIRDGGIISCFNAESGKLIYREKLGATGAYFSSPVATNGRIYIASRNGIVTVFDSGEKLNIIAQNNLGELITATPAIVDSKIYLRSEKALYAFGK